MAALLATGALVWALAGCAPTPALDSATGETLQAGVVGIAERADAGDLVGALAELDLFEEELAAAADAGRIDADREAEVREAVALVRADLESSLAEQEAAEQKEAEADASESTATGSATGDGDSGRADDTETDDSGPGNGNGNDNSGPGNNNGNGGGNGNGGNGNG